MAPENVLVNYTEGPCGVNNFEGLPHLAPQSYNTLGKVCVIKHIPPFFEKKDDFPSRNDESILKEEVHKETLKSYLNPLFNDNEEIISIEVSRQISPKVKSELSKELNLESLPKDDFDNDDDLFEMDSNNDEWKRILYGEDFERMDSDSAKTKDFDK
ncbi:hypothetical protein Tco_1458535 [Tanacetum coccineum]